MPISKDKVKKPQLPPTVMHKAWTWKYEPFQLGGMGGRPCQRPVCAIVTCQGPYDLGQCFVGYLAIAPNGATLVIEDVSGGIVGDTVAQVRADVANATIEEMREQVQEAKGFGNMAEVMTADAFWRLYCRGK